MIFPSSPPSIENKIRIEHKLVREIMASVKSLKENLSRMKSEMNARPKSVARAVRNYTIGVANNDINNDDNFNKEEDILNNSTNNQNENLLENEIRSRILLQTALIQYDLT